MNKEFSAKLNLAIKRAAMQKHLRILQMHRKKHNTDRKCAHNTQQND